VYQVYVYLIEEPGLDALLHDARGTHADVLVTCNRLRLVQGAFESVGDERERRSFVDPVLWSVPTRDPHVCRSKDVVDGDRIDLIRDHGVRLEGDRSQ